MIEQADRTTSDRIWRGRRFRFVFGGVAIALVVGVSAALLVPVDSCACGTPLDLVVQNYSHQDASVTWSQPGLLGTPLRGLSGGATAGSCATLSAALRQGAVEVSVTTSSTSRKFTLHVREKPDAGPATIVVSEDGSVEDPIHGNPPRGFRQADALC